MTFNPLPLSATAVYLTGVLVGYQIEPDFGSPITLDSPGIDMMDQPKPELLWSIAGNNISPKFMPPLRPGPSLNCSTGAILNAQSSAEYLL